MRLAMIGQCSYDIFFPLQETIQDGSKYRTGFRTECPGGPACNAAVLNGRWNRESGNEDEVFLISRVGGDDYGRKIRDTLKQSHVSLRYLQTVPGSATALSCIAVNGSADSRTILNSAMAAEQSLLAFPSRVNWILSDGHEIETAIACRKKNPGCHLLLDGGTFKKELLPLIRITDDLIISSAFAFQFSGMPAEEENMPKIFQALHSICDGRLAVTAGHRGVYFEENGHLYCMKAMPAETVDPTGAGDIFHGAYLFYASFGSDMRTCLHAGVTASGLCVQKLGSSVSVPSFRQTADLMKKHRMQVISLT